MSHAKTEFSLHASTGARKYLNANERLRFLESTQRLPPAERLFCQVLSWSGARISEALALTPAAIDLDSGTISIRTLKRRKPGMVREVPLPPSVLDDLTRIFKVRIRQRDPLTAHDRIWRWSRATAWRRVKDAMKTAQIFGACAMPKGLRHSFGVNAFQANVPPHLVQRWLGHASLSTTAIYADVSGPEERFFAARMWTRSLAHD